MPRQKKPALDGHGTRAVVYLRVSLEDGDTKHGLEVQQDYCDEYVDRQGYTVVEIIQEDGISGTKGLEDRKGLERALALCEAGEADVIVSYAQDRIARDVVLFIQVRDRLIKWRARLETFKENQDFARADSLFMGDIHAVMAAEERRRIAARLYGGRRVRSKRDGHGSSAMPFGYWMEKAAPGYTGPRVIHIDPTAARAIRMLLQLREEKRSYPVTAKALNEAGHLAPRGGLWTAGQVYAVERRAELYRTGRRRWDGIDAAQAWPVILEVSA